MKLIKTNDGLFGWKLNGKVNWCTTRTELHHIGWHSLSKNSRISKPEFDTEVDTAIDIMSTRGDDAAEFGMRGTLMFTTMTTDVA